MTTKKEAERVTIGPRLEGETDDSPRIQRAVDKARELGHGAWVWGPEAPYTIEATEARGES